jgi:hypothetical protein
MPYVVPSYWHWKPTTAEVSELDSCTTSTQNSSKVISVPFFTPFTINLPVSWWLCGRETFKGTTYGINEMLETLRTVVDPYVTVSFSQQDKTDALRLNTGTVQTTKKVITSISDTVTFCKEDDSVQSKFSLSFPIGNKGSKVIWNRTRIESEGIGLVLLGERDGHVGIYHSSQSLQHFVYAVRRSFVLALETHYCRSLRIRFLYYFDTE